MTHSICNRMTGGAAAYCFLLLASMLFSPAGAQGDESGVVRLSEPVEANDTHETFGARMPEAGQAVALADLLADGENYLDREVKVITRVAQVCQKKGCFFIAEDGTHTARVSFKDYGFFVPSDISGRTVTLAGELKRKDLSADQAEHFNEDMQAESVMKPGPQYEIVATSVRVPRSRAGRREGSAVTAAL